ncbi:glycosyl hydrolase [Candidatus Bathyarchaeota archaeon]|nr:glycosyl hydrolase [Candidatus Bathyarchaeota archaeon]
MTMQSDEPNAGHNAAMEQNIDNLLEKLTLDEKLDLLSGGTSWSTRPVERLGIKPMYMTDGPHGIGPHSSGDKTCTYFPVGICRAATWNVDLQREFGEALGEEVVDIKYHVILGPGVNIIRTPLGGRNFEYQTEDPYLNARLVVPVVRGIQSKGVSACVKHYICNNQEMWRNWVDAIVSKRALEEIYFPAFKAAVEEADAWSIMCCYNKVNGVFGAEHEKLVRDTLIKKWGFRGFYVSDWGATNFTEGPSGSMRARLSLEMPDTNRYAKDWLKRDLEEGQFTMKDVNENVRRLLRVMNLVGLLGDGGKRDAGSRNTPEHQLIARKIAEEGLVLLKNEGDILPLDPSKISSIHVTGNNANHKFSEGGGSSKVKPPHEVTPLEGIKARCKDQVEIKQDGTAADVTIVIAGLDHAGGGDSEGSDRRSFDMPGDQVQSILDAVEDNENTVVVLMSGTPVNMEPWIDLAPAVIQAWYPGMEGGHAIAAVLFGDVNPSGKLPVTFPKKLDDSPAHAAEITYPGIDDEDEGPRVEYREGIFVGYRHFDARGIEPRFPFGHGMSYTTFEYSHVGISKHVMHGESEVSVTTSIRNTGNRAGAEVIQLYIEPVHPSNVERPPRELKGFKKIFLDPGEEKNVTFTLSSEALQFFHEEKEEWVVEDGTYKIHLGSSSRDLRLSISMQFKRD